MSHEYSDYLTIELHLCNTSCIKQFLACVLKGKKKPARFLFFFKQWITLWFERLTFCGAALHVGLIDPGHRAWLACPSHLTRKCVKYSYWATKINLSFKIWGMDSRPPISRLLEGHRSPTATCSDTKMFAFLQTGAPWYLEVFIWKRPSELFGWWSDGQLNHNK